MQGTILTILLLTLAVTDGFFWTSSAKCPIKTYKSNKVIKGDTLNIHETFIDRVKAVEAVAKDCKVIVDVKGSYYQLVTPTASVPYTDYDIVVGHAFRFELHDQSDALLCNKLCLSRNPTDISEVKCFLQGVTSRGLTWSRTNSNVISDGTYTASSSGYQTLKNEVQTNCKSAKLKRELMRALRKMYEEEQESDDQEIDDEKK